MALRSWGLVVLLLTFGLLSPAFGRPQKDHLSDEVPIIDPVLPSQLGEPVSVEADTTEHRKLQGDFPIIVPVLPPQLGKPVSVEANTAEDFPSHRKLQGGCQDANPSLCRAWGTKYCEPKWIYQGRKVGADFCKLTCSQCGGCRDANPSLCQSWGTQYCDPKWVYQGRRVGADFCKKTCSQCSGNTRKPPSDEYHQQMLNLVNQGRREKGRQPLCLNNKLNAAAQAHSQDMYDNKYFSHNGRDGSNLVQRFQRVHYSWQGAAENIAMGNNDAAGTYNQWKNSPGHWNNILGDYQHMGIGKAGNVWTQVFGKSSSESCS